MQESPLSALTPLILMGFRWLMRLTQQTCVQEPWHTDTDPTSAKHDPGRAGDTNHHKFRIYDICPTHSTLCSVGYVQNHTRGIFPGITRTGKSASSVRHSHPCPELLEFCTLIPVPGSFVSSVRPCHKITGVRVQHLYTYLPRTCVSSVRLPYPCPQLL